MILDRLFAYKKGDCMPKPSGYLFLLAAILLRFGMFLEASSDSIEHYLELYMRYPRMISSLGDRFKGEIQILIDPDEMAAIEKATGREVGIVKRDDYWLWLNDACLFPNGRKGVYGRLLWLKDLESPSGVAVMPVMNDGRIVLNCNYRHATRSWEIELPRGVVNFGEDIEAAAVREVVEETGMAVAHLKRLGEIPTDTGITGTVAPIYIAKVTASGQAQPEESEAIDSILALTIHEIKLAFKRGFIECEIGGELRKAHFRDPFLAFAILMNDLGEYADANLGAKEE